jgi:uncharacterized protein YjbJ (UPF0337 family)
MNDKIMQGNWQQLKGEIRQQWGKLTDNDVAQVKGSAEKLIGTLQERYGMARSKAADDVSAFLNQMEKKFSQN